MYTIIEKMHNREFKLRILGQRANGKHQAKKNFTVSGNKE
jgi:hypothetical protein